MLHFGTNNLHFYSAKQIRLEAIARKPRSVQEVKKDMQRLTSIWMRFWQHPTKFITYDTKAVLFRPVSVQSLNSAVVPFPNSVMQNRIDGCGTDSNHVF